MEFFYKNARLPKDDKILRAVNAAASRLFLKLNNLDINQLEVSDHTKVCLGNHIQSLKNRLMKFTYILSWAVANRDIPLNQFVLVDYGGGSGILSLLAKEYGIGTVIYTDIYDVSCKDAENIGQAINNPADYYVPGDIDELLFYIKNQQITCHALASYDVIEHIYDIEPYLKKLSKISDKDFVVVMGSGANPLNPLVARSLMKQHKLIEYLNREDKPGHKQRDILKAYYDVRREIISKYAPKLSPDEVERLTKATRGLIAQDIKHCVDVYLESGKICRQPDHPTNTCDPYTGNWAEHLMDIRMLKQVLVNNGFIVKILAGYYGGGSPLKRIVACWLNLLIFLLGDQIGLWFAPFYTIYASKVESLGENRLYY